MADSHKVGATYVEGIVSGPTGERAVVEFLVDSGAKYSLLPHDVWRRLDLTAKRIQAFQLADGTTIERGVSECHIALPHGETHTPVILGDPGDVALLGVVTLEELGLVLNPFDRTLHPGRHYLLRLDAVPKRRSTFDQEDAGWSAVAIQDLERGADDLVAARSDVPKVEPLDDHHVRAEQRNVRGMTDLLRTERLHR